MMGDAVGVNEALGSIVEGLIFVLKDDAAAIVGRQSLGGSVERFTRH